MSNTSQIWWKQPAEDCVLVLHALASFPVTYRLQIDIFLQGWNGIFCGLWVIVIAFEAEGLKWESNLLQL